MADPAPDLDALLARLRLSPDDERELRASLARKDEALATQKEQELAALAAQKDREIATLATLVARKDRELAKQDELNAQKDEVIDTMQRKIQRIECARIASAFASRALVARPCRRACKTRCR